MRKTAAASSGTSARASSRGDNQRSLRLTGQILFVGGIGFLALLNVQPWIDVAKQVSLEIKNIPFLDSLIQIPYLGGWIEWAVNNIVSILGIVLWGLTQFMELIPEYVKNATAKKHLQNIRWIVYIFEFLVCFMRFPAYEGGYAALAEDAPNWDTSLIDWWNLVIFLPITMFGFEVCFRVIRNVLQGIRD